VKAQEPIYCKVDGRRIGNVPAPMLWTGVVERIPQDPEDLEGLMYLPCETCRRAHRSQWHRYEAIPSNPVVEVIVPVILEESAA
jgi:hypothetical protein